MATPVVAGAALEADDALDGRHMAEAPQAECVLDVGELLAELVQVPVPVGVAVHHQPRLLDLVARHVRLRPVALDVRGGDRKAAPRKQSQRFVVQRRRRVRRFHARQDLGPVRMRLQHGRILVAEHELDAAVLPALEAAALAEVRTDRRVLRRRHRRQHVPRMHQLLHDAAHPRHHLERAAELVVAHRGHRGGQLVQHELHPQLARLVLHDEQHLVVVGRQRMLRVQHLVQVQVVGVAHLVREVELRAFVAHDLLRVAHVTAARWLNRASRHSPPCSTCARCSTASHTSTKRVYSGVKPKRSRSGARKSPITPRAMSACMIA